MRKILITSLAFALLPASLPAQAETAPGAAQAQQSQPQQREAAPDPNRQICVSERLSGSRMPRRVCRTARQWELLQNDGSDER